MKVLIKDIEIISMSPSYPSVFKGNIGIEDQNIVFIGEVPSTFNADKVIDGMDHIAMPGLINAHTHMAMSLLRNYADDLPLMTWLSEKIWPVEAKLTSEDIYYGTMLSIAELIKSGCTSFRDMYFHMDEVAKAVELSGVRANLGEGLIGVADPDASGIDKVRNLYRELNLAADGRIVIEVAPHAPYTCPEAYLIKCGALAKDLDVPLHIHLSESRFEVSESYKNFGMSPIQKVNELGLLSGKTSGAHCVHVSEEDIELLRKTGTSVLYNPSSNLKLGNGFAPIQKMLNAGVNVALGTDGASSNNNLNLFEEMHLAGLVNKGILEDPTALPAYEVLKMATINGAKALGIDETVGSLEVGKKADLILLDFNQAHLLPTHDLISLMVYSAQASDVDFVMCNGKILYENRQILTFDEQVIKEKASIIARDLISRI
ncbi:MAG: N-ethylammeline chlorohydrolase [Clostridiales bacterium 38-18]|nr:MAG: N-ethylammeline chlorohydrolase [Clostridiales bacterium 38-18]